MKAFARFQVTSMMMFMKVLASAFGGIGSGDPAMQDQEAIMAEMMSATCPMVGASECMNSAPSCSHMNTQMNSSSAGMGKVDVSDVESLKQNCTSQGYSIDPASVVLGKAPSQDDDMLSGSIGSNLDVLALTAFVYFGL